MNKGLLIVFSGPSGTGKGTIIKELIKKIDGVKVSISATTRLPRKGEEHGREYFFISEKDFISQVSNGEMLEHALYCGNYYGTPKKNIELWLNQGLDVILEIETQGGKQVKNKCKDSIGIFVIPPTFNELSNRLVNRKTNTTSDIQKRLNCAAKEMECALDYDYTVINDKIEDCVSNMCSIIKAERLKTNRNLIVKGVLFNAKTID